MSRSRGGAGKLMRRALLDPSRPYRPHRLVRRLGSLLPAGLRQPAIRLYNRVVVIPPEPFRPGMRPKMLSIEPTSKCNLNCPFCLVGLQNSLPSTEHDLLPRGFGFMEMELFEKIIRDARDFGITKLQLHFQGEPLLHKQFPQMVRMATAAGMQTQVFTNGLVLTEGYGERIIDAGLGLLRFSVDGATEETYQKNRVGGKFERVFRNMAMMVDLARRKKSPIRLEWQMIALRNNEHEIPRAQELADQIGIPFFVKTYAVTDPELVPRNPRLQRRLHIKPCTDIYRAIFVYWNGDVVPCCYDIEGKEVVGNLRDQALTEVWESERYQDLRRRIDNAARDPDHEPELCKSCLKWGHRENATSDGLTHWSDEASDDVVDIPTATRVTDRDFV